MNYFHEREIWTLTETYWCGINNKYVLVRGLVKWHDRGLQNP